MDKTITFDLNKKHIYRILFYDFLFLILLIFLNLSWFFSERGFDSSYNVLIVIGLPIFAFFSGIFTISLDIYLNFKVLFFIQKKVLEVSDERIKYYSYFDKRIIVKKENIEKIYATNCHDGIFGSNKYIGIVTKKPIDKIKNKKLKLIHSFRTENLLNTLYINISELEGNPEYIVSEIENTLSIPIKKKNNNHFF